jgi:hypothetical protein
MLLLSFSSLAEKIEKTIIQYAQTDNYQLLIDLFGARLPAQLKHVKELPLRHEGLYFDCDYSGHYKIDADCNNGNISGSQYDIEVSADHVNSKVLQETFDNLIFKLNSIVKPEHAVKWQILNDPGEVSFEIRGKFEDSNSLNNNQPQRAESVSWAGHHWVRAFIIEGDRCKFISNKFKVNVLRETA